MQLRQLFAYICIFCSPKDPKSLFEKFEHWLTKDFVNKGYENRAVSLAMRDIEDILRLLGRNSKELNLPKPSKYKITDLFNADNKRHKGEKYQSMLNDEQKYTFQTIISAIKGPKSGSCFFSMVLVVGATNSFTIL